MKSVDTTKPSNIKCEHCKHYDEEHIQTAFVLNHIESLPICDVTGKPKHYWNRCKWFEWAARYITKEVSDENSN